VADRGIEWIDRADDSPLFLTLIVGDLVPPYSPPARNVGFIPPGEGRVDDRVLFAKVAAMASGEAPPRLEKGELERLVDLYDATILHVDEEIGRLLDHIETADLDRPTVVIVTADRGTEFMEHGRLFNSKLATEESIRVPLIVGRIPADGEARIVGDVARHVDILPTVAAFTAASSPFGVQGTSLVPALSGGRHGGPQVTVSEGRGNISVVKDHWKLLYTEETGSSQLFDLASDRWGRRDVSASFAPAKEEMQTLLDEYLDLRAGVPVEDGKLMIGGVGH
jgi:arylsulfatase A-like enzyme